MSPQDAVLRSALQRRGSRRRKPTRRYIAGIERLISRLFYVADTPDCRWPRGYRRCLGATYDLAAGIRCTPVNLFKETRIVDTGGAALPLLAANGTAALNRTYSQAAHARLSGRQIPMRFSNADLITSAFFLLVASAVAQTAQIAAPAAQAQTGPIQLPPRLQQEPQDQTVPLLRLQRHRTSCNGLWTRCSKPSAA